MQFDQFTIALLVLRPDAPEMQDAHLAHLADLHDAGYLVAAGPLLGPMDREFRGLSILTVDAEQARALKEEDPAVRAGRFSVQIFPWIVPAGAVRFARARFPRSMAETEV